MDMHPMSVFMNMKDKNNLTCRVYLNFTHNQYFGKHLATLC